MSFLKYQKRKEKKNHSHLYSSEYVVFERVLSQTKHGTMSALYFKSLFGSLRKRYLKLFPDQMPPSKAHFIGLDFNDICEVVGFRVKGALA